MKCGVLAERSARSMETVHLALLVPDVLMQCSIAPQARASARRCCNASAYLQQLQL